MYKIGDCFITLHKALHQKRADKPLQYSPEAVHALLDLQDEVSRLEVTEANYNLLLITLHEKYFATAWVEWLNSAKRVRNNHQSNPEHVFSESQ